MSSAIMNPVLGFEPGLVNNSVTNTIGTALIATIKVTTNITFAAGTAIRIDYAGFGTKAFNVAAGGPYTPVECKIVLIQIYL